MGRVSDYKQQLAALQAKYDALLADQTAGTAAYAALEADYEAALGDIDLLEQQLADCLAPPTPVPLPLLAGLQNRNVEPGGLLVPNTERKWSDLHTGPGQFDHAAFETLLAKGPFRFRPMMGRFAPRWVMDAAGSFTYQEPVSGALTEVVKWWTPAAVYAAAEFYGFLAGYDGDLQHVWGSSPMSYYAEPLQRGLASDLTRANMLDAGFTVAQDLAAHAGMIESLAAFKQTRVGVAYNPYQRLDPSGTWMLDSGVMADQMSKLRAAVPNAVLHNCSFREKYLASPLTANGGVYGQMAALGGPRSVQTAMWSLVGDLRKCLTWLAANGYHAVELPKDHDLTPDEIAAYDAALKANA